MGAQKPDSRQDSIRTILPCLPTVGRRLCPGPVRRRSPEYKVCAVRLERPRWGAWQGTAPVRGKDDLGKPRIDEGDLREKGHRDDGTAFSRPRRL